MPEGLIMKKSFLALSTLSLVAAFGLAACGDDSSSSAPADDTGSYKSLDAAPECTDDLDGEAIFVGSKNTKYICDAEEGVWVKKTTASSSSAKAKSSSSSAKAKSSSSSAKAKSSSSSAKAKSSSSEDVEEPDFYKSVDDLPKCNDKTEGDTLLVGKTKDTAVEYICKNNQWAKADIEETILSEGSMPNGTVIIGNQVWTGKNLDIAKDKNGKAIGHCYQDKDSNCKMFGRLYNWTEAMALDSKNLKERTDVGTIKKNHQGICPDGYHIPTGTELKNLFEYVNGTKIAEDIRKKLDIYGGIESILLRSTNYNADEISVWSDASEAIPAYDSFGMMFVGSGYATPYEDCQYDEEKEEDVCTIKYNYNAILEEFDMWTTTETGDEEATDFFTHFNSDGFYDTDINKSYLLSVRCIMNKTADEYKKTDEYKKMLEEAKKAKK